MLFVVVLVAGASVAALSFMADRYGKMLARRHENAAAAAIDSPASREVAAFLRVREEVLRAVEGAPGERRETLASEARDRALGDAPLDRRRHARVEKLYRDWLANPFTAPTSYRMAFEQYRERLALTDAVQEPPLR
jgi:hypothetical protein